MLFILTLAKHEKLVLQKWRRCVAEAAAAAGGFGGLADRFPHANSCVGQVVFLEGESSCVNSAVVTH